MQKIARTAEPGAGDLSYTALKDVFCGNIIFFSFDLTNKTHAQPIVVGLGSLMTDGRRNSTAFFRPSSMLMRLSSCSIERTRS